MHESSVNVGVVVIGRNEGERLRRCLHALNQQHLKAVVYVDSGSTDDSVAISNALRIETVVLDTWLPFTMARGRNAGFEHLIARHPYLEKIQFVDGDCELDPGWLEVAEAFLSKHPDVAAVAGRLQERSPNSSIYNRLMHMEWNDVTGEVKACGGIAMYRVDAFQKADGFDRTMISGEEADLCIRIRHAGWKIVRIAEQMAIHDGGIVRFSQWWIRAMRGGHAFAQGAALHGHSPEYHGVRKMLSALGYGVIVPLAITGMALWFGSIGAFREWVVVIAILLACAVYGGLALKIYRSRIRMGDSTQDSILYTCFCVLGKFPESLGILKYASNRFRGRPARLMEYKKPEDESRP